MKAPEQPNARPFSAAPDLIDALNAMLSEFVGEYEESWPSVVLARAAVAKAGIAEQKANTSLIDAAPDLLAALQSLVSPRHSAALGGRIDAAHAAITKATA